MKIVFFEITSEDEKYFKDKIGEGNLVFSTEKLDREHIPDGSYTDAEVISVFTKSKVDEEVINAFPNLKLIATRTTGYDHIDLVVAEKKGIVVCNVPSYGENTVAEFAFGLLLSVSRKIFLSYDRIRETGSFSLKGLQGIDLQGKTIGVVGTGRIGKNAIRIANGFGMKIIAYDMYPSEQIAKDYGVQYVSFNELLGRSDVITFHVPDLLETRHMINMQNIDLIKRGAILINTARGPVVETEALVKALNDGILAGAGLDVLEEEVATKDELEFLLHGREDGHNLKTILQNHLLIDMDNVIITPHNAFNSKEALTRILEMTAENITKFEKGETQNTVKTK